MIISGRWLKDFSKERCFRYCMSQVPRCCGLPWFSLPWVRAAQGLCACVELKEPVGSEIPRYPRGATAAGCKNEGPHKLVSVLVFSMRTSGSYSDCRLSVQKVLKGHLKKKMKNTQKKIRFHRTRGWFLGSKMFQRSQGYEPKDQHQLGPKFFLPLPLLHFFFPFLFPCYTSQKQKNKQPL